MEIGSYDDAIDLLNKSLEIQTSIYGENNPRSCEVLTKISQCYSKMKEYDSALNFINIV